MNREYFEYLYEKYFNHIARFINTQYRIDPDSSKDITQEIFKVMWKKREKLYVENEKKILNWIYVTAKKKVAEYNRKRRKYNFDSDADPEELPNDSAVEYEDSVHNEGYDNVEEKYQKYLKEIKETLTEKEQTLFELMVEKDFDQREAAAVLGLSDVNFRVRWHRLRNKLKPIVEKLIEK